MGINLNKNKFLGSIFGLVGLAIIIYWIYFIAQGHMADGFFTVIDDGYIIFHIIAETITALACFVAGILLFRGSLKAFIVSGITFGLLLYAGFNTLGWRLRDDLFITLLLTGTIIFSLAGIVYILATKQSDKIK